MHAALIAITAITAAAQPATDPKSEPFPPDNLRTLNRTYYEYPKEQHAWPHFRDAYNRLAPAINQLEVELKQAADEDGREATSLARPPIDSEHPDYQRLMDFIFAHTEDIEELQRSLDYEVFGYRFSTIQHEPGDDGTIPEPPEEPVQQSLLLDILLIPPPYVTRSSGLFLLQTHASLIQNDTIKITHSLRAIHNTITHIHNMPSGISKIIALRTERHILSIGFLEQLFTLGNADSIKQMRDILFSIDQTNRDVGIRDERIFFEDILQRCYDYSVDPPRITPQGYDLTQPYINLPYPIARLLVLPPDDQLSLLMPLETAAYERLNLPIFVEPDPLDIADDIYSDKFLLFMGDIAYAPALLFQPHFDGIIRTYLQTRERRLAAIAAIDLELLRRELGRVPTQEEAAHLLPPDFMQPDAPLRFRFTDNGPIVYSVGFDLDDDHGTQWPQEYRFWMTHRLYADSPPDGDFILAPSRPSYEP